MTEFNGRSDYRLLNLCADYLTLGRVSTPTYSRSDKNKFFIEGRDRSESWILTGIRMGSWVALSYLFATRVQKIASQDLRWRVVGYSLSFPLSGFLLQWLSKSRIETSGLFDFKEGTKPCRLGEAEFYQSVSKTGVTKVSFERVVPFAFPYNASHGIFVSYDDRYGNLGKDDKLLFCTFIFDQRAETKSETVYERVESKLGENRQVCFLAERDQEAIRSGRPVSRALIQLLQSKPVAETANKPELHHLG